jgi:hypothetical protein
MVDYCANPGCMKPLHYLPEGTIYIFEEADSGKGIDNPLSHKLEHYWLCGDCSSNHLLERTAEKELRLVSKQSLRFVKRPSMVPERLLAS